MLESCEDVASHLQRGIRELPSTKALDRLLVEGKGGCWRVPAWFVLQGLSRTVERCMQGLEGRPGAASMRAHPSL